MYFRCVNEKNTVSGNFIERDGKRTVSGLFVGLITGKQKSKLLSVVSDTGMSSPAQPVGGEHSWFLFMTPRVQICD